MSYSQGAPNGRRILFIGLSYFSYTARIIESLREKGFTVRYYPSEIRSFWSKTLRKYLPGIYAMRLRRYHDSIVERERDTLYDYVFFLQIHNLDVDHVEQLRSTHRKAKFILYNWDSLATHDYRPYLRFLDATFTFDRDDARSLPASYLPLFALPEYFAARPRSRPSYDLYFVGTIVTLQRFAALKRLDEYCREHGLRFGKHFHCSPAIMLMLIGKGLFINGMTLASLSTTKIIELMNDSIAVFDFPNHAQSGYTMRLIENMCAGKKIVTFNPAVRAEPFFSEDQFFVTEGLDFTGLAEFIRKDARQGEAATNGVFRSEREPDPTRPVTAHAPVRHAEFALAQWLDRIFEA